MPNWYKDPVTGRVIKYVGDVAISQNCCCGQQCCNCPYLSVQDPNVGPLVICFEILDENGNRYAEGTLIRNDINPPEGSCWRYTLNTYNGQSDCFDSYGVSEIDLMCLTTGTTIADSQASITVANASCILVPVDPVAVGSAYAATNTSSCDALGFDVTFLFENFVVIDPPGCPCTDAFFTLHIYPCPAIAGAAAPRAISMSYTTGDILHEKLKEHGFLPREGGCGCENARAEMNKLGPEGCLANMASIKPMVTQSMQEWYGNATWLELPGAMIRVSILLADIGVDKIPTSMSQLAEILIVWASSQA